MVTTQPAAITKGVAAQLAAIPFLFSKIYIYILKIIFKVLFIYIFIKFIFFLF